MGRSLADDKLEVKISSGEALEVATGAGVPAGATAVLKSEDCQVRDGLVIFDGEIAPGLHIRPSGAEAKVNDLLVSAGKLLTDFDVALLATAGYDSLEVFELPAIEMLVCGDELVSTGLPKAGAIRDSLTLLLPDYFEGMALSTSTPRESAMTVAL